MYTSYTDQLYEIDFEVLHTYQEVEICGDYMSINENYSNAWIY
jgi:hypothetical protein